LNCKEEGVSLITKRPSPIINTSPSVPPPDALKASCPSHALLSVVYGERELFDDCSLASNNSYLWACASLVEEAWS